MTNIFGPGHHPSTGEITVRPTQTATGSTPDTFFGQCDSAGVGGTHIDEMLLNLVIANLRRMVRTAGAAQNELSDDMLAEALARYAAGGDFVMDSGIANAYVVAAPLQFKAPLALFHGMRMRWRPGAAPTGPSTVNAYNLGLKALLRPDGAAIQTGDFDAAIELETEYDTAADSGSGGHRIMPWALPLTAVGKPEGYLTLLNAGGGGPVPSSDISAATALYYSPDVGNACPVYNGARFVRRSFAEATLALHSSHTANLNFDVFGFVDPADGVTFKVGTGPAWSTSTAGAGARGTGAATTELVRLGGFMVNAVAITARNGSTTFAVPVNRATYLGSFRVGGSNGQISLTTSYGQSRIWPLWNCFNRRPLALKGGAGTASWTYNTNTVRASNGDAANSLSLMIGLREEMVRVRFGQSAQVQTRALATMRNGIGWNSTTTASGRQGRLGVSVDSDAGGGDSTINQGNLDAEHARVAAIGLHTITALENVSAAASVAATFFGTESDMMLTAEWSG